MPQDEENPTPESSGEEVESESGSQPADTQEDVDSASGGGGEGESQDDAEAAALAAAMDAVNQVQGVADSVSTPESDAASPEPFSSPELTGDGGAAGSSDIDLLSDVHMDVRIELGRTKMFVEDVLKLGDGAVVELDKLAGDPVDVFVNNRRVARGEVLVLNDLFCVRINEVVDITVSED